MPTTHRSGLLRKLDLPFVLLMLLLAVCCIAGGASRADVMGQVIVRATAWLTLVVMALAGARPSGRDTRAITILFFAIAALPLLQLVPLPPALWEQMPGRAALREAAAASGQSQPWRPWSIVPGATFNAASSLVVPAAVLVLLAAMKPQSRAKLPGLLLQPILLGTLIGLLQFSGAGFDNPLINDTQGQVSGFFANRNHFALLLAMGCLLAPAWAFANGRKPEWRALLMLGLVLLFFLVLLASGSRAGLLAGMLAIGLALLLVRRAVRRELRNAPRWAFTALVAALLATLVIFVLVTIAADRAAAIHRAVQVDASADMRARALPTVLDMMRIYFPSGSGFGGFDPLFRIHEPFALLKPTYFNHAHNDFLEIIIDGGLPAAIVMVAAIGWWLLSSIKVWRASGSAAIEMAKLGSAILLLTMIASAVDYPARTPMIMAMIAMAADWLNRGIASLQASALPTSAHDL